MEAAAQHDGPSSSVCSTCLRKIKLSTVPADGLVLTCDSCDTLLSAGTKIWSCATCDHDVCQKCKPPEDSLDLQRGAPTPDPMEDGEEDGEGEGEDDDSPEAQVAKQRRVAAAVDRQRRLLAGSKHFVGGRRRQRGDGEEGAGEEGGDDETEEGANRLAGVLSQGIMVCDSMHMVPPNALLPGPSQELQNWHRRRRLGLVSVPAQSGVAVGDAPGAGPAPPRLEYVPATPGELGPAEFSGAASLSAPSVASAATAAPAEAAPAEVLGYPLVLMRSLIEQVYTYVHRHHSGHIDWTAVAASLRPQLQPEQAHRLWRLVAYRLATPTGYEDAFYEDPSAGAPVGTGHPHTKRKRASLPASLAQVEPHGRENMPRRPHSGPRGCAPLHRRTQLLGAALWAREERPRRVDADDGLRHGLRSGGFARSPISPLVALQVELDYGSDLDEYSRPASMARDRDRVAMNVGNAKQPKTPRGGTEWPPAGTPRLPTRAYPAAAGVGWPKLHEDGRGPLNLGLPPPHSKKAAAAQIKEGMLGCADQEAYTLKEAMRLTVTAKPWNEADRPVESGLSVASQRGSPAPSAAPARCWRIRQALGWLCWALGRLSALERRARGDPVPLRSP